MTYDAGDLDPRPWIVGADSCDIEDHEFGDIATGQRVQFAVVFSTGLLRPAQVHERRASGTGSSGYDVTAVVARTQGGIVLDFGLEALVVGAPPRRRWGRRKSGNRPQTGDWVQCAGGLQMDVETTKSIRVPRALPSRPYTWRVDQITRIRWDAAGHQNGEEVVSTTSVTEDEGNGFYYLRCRPES